MRREFALLGGGVALLAAAAWGWQGGDKPPETGRVVVEEPAEAMPGPIPLRPADPQAGRVDIARIVLLETETPDEDGPGSATIRYPDGTVRRLPVGSPLDPWTRLSDVTDGFAIFGADGHSVSVPVTGASVQPGDSMAGIDFNARPDRANPAMARP